MTKSPSPKICVIVPVRLMAGRLGNLKACIDESNTLDLPIKFVLVHDVGDLDTGLELRSLAKIPCVEYHEAEFGSPGLTRNIGLEISCSQWVVFWDSDDLGNPKEIFDAVMKASSTTNVIIGGYQRRVYSGSKEVVEDFPAPSRKLTELMMQPGLWRFVFRRDFISGVRFGPFSMGEDQVFLVRLQIKFQEVEYVDKVFYSYCAGHENQLTGNALAISQIRGSIQDVIKCIQEREKLEAYTFVILARLIVTALKNGHYRVTEFTNLFFGRSKVSLKKRANLVFGFLKVSIYTSQRLFERK